MICFIYTLNLTEQKMEDLLLRKVTAMEYDLICDIDLKTGKHHLVEVKEKCRENVLNEGIS